MIFELFQMLEGVARAASSFGSSSTSNKPNDTALDDKLDEIHNYRTPFLAFQKGCDEATKALKAEKPQPKINKQIIKEIAALKKEATEYIEQLNKYEAACKKAARESKAFPPVPGPSKSPDANNINTVTPRNLAIAYVRLAAIVIRNGQSQNLTTYDSRMANKIAACQANLAAVKNGSSYDLTALNQQLSYIDKEFAGEKDLTPKERLPDEINKNIMIQETMILDEDEGGEPETRNELARFRNIVEGVDDNDLATIQQLKSKYQEYQIKYEREPINHQVQGTTLFQEGQIIANAAKNNPAAQNTGVAQPAATHPMQINNQNASPQPQPGGGNPMHQQFQQRVRAQHAYQNTYIVSPHLYNLAIKLVNLDNEPGTAEYAQANPIAANNITNVLTEMDTATGTARNVFVEYTTPNDTKKDKEFKVAASIEAAIELIGEPLSIDGTDEEYLQTAFAYCLKHNIEFDNPPSSARAKRALAYAEKNRPPVYTGVRQISVDFEPEAAMNDTIAFHKKYIAMAANNNNAQNQNNNDNNAPGPNQNPNQAQGFVVDSDWQNYLSKLDQWGKDEFGKINMDQCDPAHRKAMKTKKNFYENVSTVSSALLAACKTPMPQADREALIKALYKFDADIGAISNNRQEADITTWAPVFTAANNAIDAARNAANAFRQGGPANNNKNNNMKTVYRIDDNLKKDLENMEEAADKAKTKIARDNQGKSIIEENPDYKFHNQLQIQCDELAKIANNPMHADDGRKFENDADAFLNKARALSNKGAGRNAKDELALKDQGEALIKFGNEAVQRTKPNPAPPQAEPSLSITPQKI